ncbi:hypothetical protein PF010_g28335 [Phytophthora fragariae]|nr:hypothetical protein PF003_g22158 [Phytophthora fragariae]KAE8920565.1 hypothetical protein PF009_g29142 [Phytophthora fragariae]KAE8966942.1 hypothetical protein PF011_g27748 [Phytophthora fragariae]KAE9065121.1 hypothetical protein PF010_g28335 [Phytophthora fragariae]KAE9074276.1 hypothetical protein PF006_g28576 [Phytophthora fragariae]
MVMTAFSVIIAANVVFPIPFFVASTAPVVCVVHLVLFRVIVGNRVMRTMAAHRSQLTRYSNFVNAQALMALVFPAYEA